MATKVLKGWTKVQVDTHLYSNHSSGRAMSQRVDLKVPRVGTESLRWTRMSERLGAKSWGSDTKSEGQIQSPKVGYKVQRLWVKS